MPKPLAKKIALVLSAIGLLCVGYGYFIEPHRLVVTQQNIQIENWNPAFDGFRIAMIADIHGGSNGVTSEKLQEIVRRVNEQNVDLVVMLGDYVSQAHTGGPIADRPLKMPMSEIADGLAGITAKHGVLCVFGNHDGYYGDELIAAELERVGYKVLQNEVETITRDGQPLRILGLKDHLKLTDGWTRTAAEVRELIRTTGAGDVVILEHSPDTLQTVTGYLSVGPELKLFLAGHTHGGQIWLPLLGTPAIPSSYGQRYARGHVKENGVDMFVTSGIGESLLPFRFMVPPEIAVITIRSARSS
ncbi:MAG: metallophosphoesterase [Blastocatellia bacterium]|nr:metallophosphoesterase [Blastocatellia bacterium]